MAASSKAKKKVGTKKRARAKTAAPAAKKTKAARPESDDSSETLRASAKAFAARLLR